ncbi:MAG TPA: class I SAM-dependent methyltransferase [Planococcus sp. (in: firmicutes)]|nr:class I SAM-dependent methyltransferase [Planococcus sp. (in: firmicutes)]
MEFKGSSVYDEKDFLTDYLKRRGRKESPNNAIEKPNICELLGDVKGKAILDLGCGDGSFGLELLGSGAASYTGIEGSREMALLATSATAQLGGKIRTEDLELFQADGPQFDLIVSRFVIHYLSDIMHLFKEINKALMPGGKFVFTVQHPLTTSSFASKAQGDRRGDWLVDDYFREGERREPWISKTVVKHHRTTESYFTALAEAGFAVTALREGMPERANFESAAEFERRERIPLMLILSGQKQEN